MNPASQPSARLITVIAVFLTVAASWRCWPGESMARPELVRTVQAGLL